MAPLRGDALAYATLDHIHSHPERWDQGEVFGFYAGADQACFIGRAVLLALGGEIPRDEDFIDVACQLLGWTQENVRRVFTMFTRDYARLAHEVLAIVRAGDIGRTIRKREYEDPFAEPAPAEQPQPDTVPEQAPEPVPA
jgi:hypothetical protein